MIIKVAITSVYRVIAVWMPVTVVPTSSATVAMETFMTELSSVIRNCADASVTSTVVDTSAEALSRDRHPGSVPHTPGGRRQCVWPSVPGHSTAGFQSWNDPVGLGFEDQAWSA